MIVAKKLTLEEKRAATLKNRKEQEQASPKRVRVSAEDIIPVKKKKSAAETPPAVTTTAGQKKKSKSLAVPTKGGAIALPMADRSHMIDQSDMVIPKLKVAQGLSKVVEAEQVKVGNWYHTLRNNSLGKSVIIIPIDMRKSQGMFVQGQGVVCRSFDLVQGQGDPGILCEGTPEEIESVRADDRGCEYRLWTTDEKTGRRVKPPCELAYNFPVLILDGEDWKNGKVRKAMLSFRSTHTKAAKEIVTIVHDEEEPIWYQHVFRLTLVSQQFARGASFTPQVEWLGYTPKRLLKKAESFAGIVNEQFIRANIEKDDTE